MLGDYKDLKTEYEDKGKYLGNWFKDIPVNTMKPYLFFQAGMIEALQINDPHLF